MDPVPEVKPTRLRSGGTNAVGKMLGVLGDEWTLLLVNEALLGARRRQDFGERLPITDAVLTTRLNRLESEDMLHRASDGTYAPTNKLVSLWGMLIGIWDWERQWLPGRAAVLDDIRHRSCGEPLSPSITCHACLEPLRRQSIRVGFGPSGAWARSVPEGSSRRRWTGPRVTTEAGLYPESMSLFGNRWSASLLGAAFMGLDRYADFEIALGAPPVVVSARLHQFVNQGVMTQNESGADHRTTYELTDKGWAFHPVVVLAIAWAQRWYVAPEGPALEQTHAPCGTEFLPRVVCRHCRHVVLPGDIDVRRRPVD
ncbi:MAG: winged helix-turn-helix transcriptional regulator [Nocardioides sp.]|uniref:winged helix-turn-helix transcriptional regulator n=1 Tax=Nocardioides sp. TaxID=35761 RepID=UPI003F0834FD